MNQFRFVASALVVGGLIALTQPTHAQSAPAPSTAPVAQQPGSQESRMMDMQQKMADMKTMDAKLDALVTKMNTAKGNAKVDAMAELLTAMVQNHKAMHEGMMQMQNQMMMEMHGQMMKPMGGAK